MRKLLERLLNCSIDKKVFVATCEGGRWKGIIADDVAEFVSGQEGRKISEVKFDKSDILSGGCGYITPRGRKLVVDHERYAKEYLKKHKQSSPRYSQGAVVAKFMSLSKYVRYFIEGEETSFTIVTPVRPAQLATMRRLSKDQDVVFDIVDAQGDALSYGYSMKDMISHLRGQNLLESTIDFPQPSLDMIIWDKTADSYVIKPEVKKIILDTLGKYTKIKLIELADAIHITGSSGTNQYTFDCDIDCHLVIDKNKLNNAEEIQKDVFRFFRLDENIVYIDTHPIEVYLQYNPRQELLAEACYDLLRDEWIKGPKIVSTSYDPYTDFSDIMDDVKELAVEADEELGELKRDVVDYDTITAAIGNLSGDVQRRLLTKLKDKLFEIEDDIENLKKIKLDWITLRRESSVPVSEEEALEDIETAKRWRDANGIFKFLSRYHYIKTISKLEQMLDDSKLEPEELNTMRQMMGVER